MLRDIVRIVPELAPLAAEFIGEACAKIKSGSG
jgi:hypothetical protein